MGMLCLDPCCEGTTMKMREVPSPMQQVSSPLPKTKTRPDPLPIPVTPKQGMGIPPWVPRRVSMEARPLKVTLSKTQPAWGIPRAPWVPPSATPF